ncbi:MAG: alpha/beta hydrolase [Armatimonadota bacterium]|nr:alpha/beta hydrolase [Armatimonadota bacterium]
MPTIKVDTLSIDYYEAGNGIPVVFIPGITEYKEAFVFQFRGLQDSYRVISYDVRRGLKRATDYTLDLLVQDLKGLLKGLKIDNAVICGHSFGGLIALKFALTYPEETSALILISAFASLPPLHEDRLLGWISSAGHPFHKSLGAGLRVQIAKLLGVKGPKMLSMVDEVSAIRAIARQAVKTSRTTITQRLRIIHSTDLSANLREITVPTLVVAGAKDQGIFLKATQQLYEEIPNASLEVIEGGGHFCFLTRHDQFNAILDEFLTKHLQEMA